jgi:EAL domain-containing protein (putative c-di-GMP-specific phosphodiesterase class I)
MYRAKRDGGGRYHFFSPELTEQAMQQLTIKNALRHPDLHNQLILHYQPQVSLQSGRITGVEALVRWQHPTRGLLSPGQFIPIAEAAGLIHIIGEWALKSACNQAKVWRDNGYPPVRVAVNVSAHEIKTAQLVDAVEAVLRQTGLDPCLLELEITEGALQIGDGVLEVLDRIRRFGVQLALDDFGAGYSSLGSIVFALTASKLTVLIQTLQDTNDDHVRAIIAMGRSLKLEILAEGGNTCAA